MKPFHYCINQPSYSCADVDANARCGRKTSAITETIRPGNPSALLGVSVVRFHSATLDCIRIQGKIHRTVQSRSTIQSSNRMPSNPALRETLLAAERVSPMSRCGSRRGSGDNRTRGIHNTAGEGIRWRAGRRKTFRGFRGNRRAGSRIAATTREVLLSSMGESGVPPGAL